MTPLLQFGEMGADGYSNERFRPDTPCHTSMRFVGLLVPLAGVMPDKGPVNNAST